MKILFIGEVGSIHVARWVNQLNGTGWDFRVYQSVPFGQVVRSEFLSGLMYLPHEMHRPDSVRAEYTLSHKKRNLVTRLFDKCLRIFRITHERSSSPENRHARFLADLIRHWRPDIIHSLGMFCNWRDNGIVLLRARKIVGGKLPCPWIVSSWGADLDLYPYLGKKEHAEAEAILEACDGLVVEGERDLALAKRLGFGGTVLAKLPAYGGTTWTPKDYCIPGSTSGRQVILLKGRDNTDDVRAGGDPQGRAMTALAAFRMCRDLLQSYSIIITQATPSVETEAKALAETGMDITVYPNSISLPYEQWLKLLGSARLLVAVTVSDGLPSTLIEAMSLGVFPIHSSLETVREWIKDGQNGILVQPEDVQSVARALRRALKDDALVDRASEYNLELVAKNLSDLIIRPQVIDMYIKLKLSRSNVKTNLS